MTIIHSDCVRSTDRPVFFYRPIKLTLDNVCTHLNLKAPICSVTCRLYKLTKGDSLKYKTHTPNVPYIYRYHLIIILLTLLSPIASKSPLNLSISMYINFLFLLMPYALLGGIFEKSTFCNSFSIQPEHKINRL